MRVVWLATGAVVAAALAAIPYVSAKDNPESAVIEVPVDADAASLPTLAPLVKAVEPAVVAIEVEGKSEEVDLAEIPPMFRPFVPEGPHRSHGEGSGFVISADGHVLTNNHVIEGADRIVAKFADGREVTAEVIGRDPATDVALLQLDGDRNDWAHVKLGSSAGLEVGDWVVAIGNPLGLGLTVTAGILSGKGREIGHDAFDDFLQTDAAINMGNSGGPLFDLHGRVVGMNTAIAQGANTIGFAVPADLIADLLEELTTEGRVARGYLGVQVQPMDPVLARTLGTEKGALVSNVQPGTPASESGIEQGDVILGVAKRPIADAGDLIDAVAAHKPGEKVSVDVLRDGKARSFQVRLAERRLGEDEPAAAEELAEPMHGKVGVSLAPVPERISEITGTTGGAIVESVVPDSPADGKLLPGDVIVEVNRKPVKDPADAAALLGKGTGAALVRVIRDGTSVYVAVERGDGG
ncbi:MAG: trypsin-like peptidase domain-containing protein [Deltaproteobacteria bacterium]|nr:trypsin-like peptidase domain-containing protein [Deltaproteobacteria bacterium]